MARCFPPVELLLQYGTIMQGVIWENSHLPHNFHFIWNNISGLVPSKDVTYSISLMARIRARSTLTRPPSSGK
jgi:hypothetical protein